MKSSLTARIVKELFPDSTGHKSFKPTLCIGLDIAWFGGSKNNPDSQYDFLVSTVLKPGEKSTLQCKRVELVGRDPDAELIAKEIGDCVDKCKDVERVVLAIDAPLQTKQIAPVPPKKREFRECERHFNKCRKAIDMVAGGSNGWHPNVQPGVPLAPRVKSLLEKVGVKCRLRPWTKEIVQADTLVVECFPAEAIWAAKRLDQFPENLVATEAHAYKNQHGSHLSAAQVRKLVETTLMDSFKPLTGDSHQWPRLVEGVISWMLTDKAWQKDGLYRGGKLLDDVVDSMIALATALSYANGNAHVWQHSDHPDDGHIIGPGRFR